MVDEVTEVKPTATVDAWASRFIIIALGIALVVSMVSIIVFPLVGVNLSAVVSEKIMSIADKIITGMFALYGAGTLAYSAMKASK